MKRTYDLHANDEIVGRIRWPKLFGSLAEADYGTHRWTFKRGGFLRPRVTVREPSSEIDIAVLELSWGGSGMLKVGDATRFRWERTGFWSHRFAFADESGTELIGIEPSFGLTRRTATVDVSAKASKTPELGLLLTLGWYVIMLIADDEGAAAVVVCCS